MNPSHNRQIRYTGIFFLLFCSLLCSISVNTVRAQDSSFRAKHVELSGTVVFEGTPTEVMALLEPKGKPLWATSWNMEYIHPSSGEAVPGAVVRQSHRSGAVYQDWLLSEYDPPRRIKYVISVPEMEIWEFDIHLEPAEQETTRATVHHRITSLSDEANASVQRFADAFEDYLSRWNATINALLKAE